MPRRGMFGWALDATTDTRPIEMRPPRHVIADDLAMFEAVQANLRPVRTSARDIQFRESLARGAGAVAYNIEAESQIRRDDSGSLGHRPHPGRVRPGRVNLLRTIRREGNI
jgi:hypothetical protein